jgi:rfaE bifunctional protein kinase chain/domain
MLKEAFERFNAFNVLIIGDVMIDAYLWGKVARISPEAPVPVVSVTNRENRMGGAANVGLNIRSLGATPVMCAIIGNDDSGQVFLDLLKKRQMTHEGIMVSEKRQTTIKTRVISDGQHLLRVDDETSQPLDKALEKQFISHISGLFSQFNFDAVVFEDYDKGNITPNIIKHIVQIAKEKNIPTLVDPKKRNFSNYTGVSLFKPNFKEICEGLKQEIPKGDFDQLHHAAEKLRTQLNAGKIMVTLSELGVYITHNGSYHQLPAQIRDIADVSGAGDTVISVAACCLAAGLEADKVAAISNIAGGLVCEKVGVVPIDKEMLFNESVRFFIQKTKTIKHEK